MSSATVTSVVPLPTPRAALACTTMRSPVFTVADAVGPPNTQLGGLAGIVPVSPLNVTTTGTPDGPVDPVAPVAPVAPVKPRGPVIPVAPVAPVGPVGPMSPDLTATLKIAKFGLITTASR